METGEVARTKLVQPSCERIVERHDDMLRERERERETD